MTMPTAKDYFETLTTNARAEHNAWWLTSERTGSEESRKAKLRATLQFFGTEDKLDALTTAMESAPERTSLSDGLQGLVDQMTSDLVEYVRPEELQLFNQTHFGILPLSSVDGFCIDRTLQGKPIDGYLVILNEGLYVCAQLLAKAFVLENLGGDLIDYQRTGRHDFDVAIHHYLEPSGKNANRVFFERVPPDIEGQLSAAQSSMAILILEFVSLHEFGHITHRDFDLMGTYRFHIGQTAAVPNGATERYWIAEHLADEYSMGAICRHSKSDVSRWANFLAVYVFFGWLARVERLTGRPLCPLHPSPASRGTRLLAWMHDSYPASDQILNYIEKTEEIMASWSQAQI